MFDATASNDAAGQAGVGGIGGHPGDGVSGLVGLLRADRDQFGCDVDRGHPRARGSRGQRDVAGAAGEIGEGGVAHRPASIHGGNHLGRDRRDALADRLVTTGRPDRGG